MCLMKIYNVPILINFLFMQKRTLSFAAAVAAFIIVGGGCASQSAVAPQAAAPAAAPAPKQAAVPTPTPAPAAAPATPGQTPFDFPIQEKTSATAGQYVLAPTTQQIASGASGTYIYYAATMVTPGANESVIKTLSGSEQTIPNALIIVIRKGAKVKVGDIVLTWWQSGSGMKRAIVVGGSPTEPQVVYLDGDNMKAEKLLADSFHILPEGKTAGNKVMCVEGSDRKSFQVVAEAAGGKKLVIGWAGKMSVTTSENCKSMPFDSSIFKVGDAVKVPVIATYKDAKVTKVDAKNGRISAVYQFAGKDEEKVFSIGEVAKGF